MKLRSDRQSVKVGTMLEILRTKFAEPGLHQQLLETGDAEFVDGNTCNDGFCGVSVKTGKGKKTLRSVLMQVREELQAS